MSRSVSVSLQKFPHHAAIIGDMLLCYADLEAFMVDLLAQALGKRDLQTAVRILYRLRGANDRINVTDALVRPLAKRLGLEGQYCQWLGAMRLCRVLRNQYAHGSFTDEDGMVYMLDLEASAKTVEGQSAIQAVPIDLPILKEQQAFFEYTTELIVFLNHELTYRRDRRRRHGYRYPKSRAAPKLHSPLGERIPQAQA